MTFGETYGRLLEGYKIRRKSWAEGQYVTLPYTGAKHLVICMPGKQPTAWSPKLDDLFDRSAMKSINDWHVIN